MNVSRRWLEEFLRRPLAAQDVASRLAMLGAPVDAIETLGGGLRDIRVALVEAVRPHPNADRLRLCVVNDGSPERRTVVCGAPNVTAGKKYPFAPVGATVPAGKGGAPMRLERARIRGELSEGMLCSARELGLGQDHDGLLELETAAAPGTALLEALPIGDDRLVVDVSPNRPDLLGHKGIARELAAAYGTPFRLPLVPGAETLDIPPARRVGAVGSLGAARNERGVSVSLEDLEGCRRFHAALIRGVRIAPSPSWLAQRLEAVGVRAINNVVDATNYVMLELGHPMHAYDAARVAGPALTVRRASPGEALVTLDGQRRALDAEMTIIADAAEPIGIAGVMGGAGTEVRAETTEVLLEAAWWTPARIRRTRGVLGLASEASYRFERGVDLWGGAEAMRRCIELVLATAGGTLADAPVDLWPEPSHPPRIFLRPARVAQVLGVELPWSAIERHLGAVGATALAKPEDGRLAVEVPGWRPDLREEIDLIEEIARLHGYDNFPVELRRFRVGSLADAPIERAASHVRRGLAAQGLLETMGLPMVPDRGPDAVRLRNPLSATDAHLRQALLPGLVRAVEANWACHARDVRLFEVGTVFRAAAGRPIESRHVAAIVTGARAPRHWTGTGRDDYDRWDLKGLFEAAAALANPVASIQVEGDSWVAVAGDGRVVGRAAALEADAPPWAAPVFGLEIELDPTARAPTRFRSLPSTPSSARDFALLLPDTVTAEAVRRVLEGVGNPLLAHVAVRDEYRPQGAAALRSVAFRLTFRAADRTLRDSEVDAAERQLLGVLEQRLGVRRRDAASMPSPGD
ncbi:MAG TPA: phenylalanine--tRNA ligase subunit beta [Gemmatimonadales bacterium]|nr:phenylalanine--tRNA ligase subunit beta [Gemmatimonadales bacterium]